MRRRNHDELRARPKTRRWRASSCCEPHCLKACARPSRLPEGESPMKCGGGFLAAFAATSISIGPNPRRRMARPADQDVRAVFRRLKLRHHRTHRRPQNGRAPGQQVIVENRVGGSTIIGTDAVAKSAPDGYTLLLANTTTHAASAALNATCLSIREGFRTHRDDRGVAFCAGWSDTGGGADLEGFRRAGEVKAGLAQLRSAGTGHSRIWRANCSSARPASMSPTTLSRQRAVDDRPDAGPHRPIGQHDPADAPHIREGKLRALATMSEKRNAMLPTPDRGRGRRPGCEAAL